MQGLNGYQLGVGMVQWSRVETRDQEIQVRVSQRRQSFPIWLRTWTKNTGGPLRVCAPHM